MNQDKLNKIRKAETEFLKAVSNPNFRGYIDKKLLWVLKKHGISLEEYNEGINLLEKNNK